jgi:hypothetical protein
MIRSVRSVGLVVVLGVLAAGCGGGEDDAGDPAETPANQPGAGAAPAVFGAPPKVPDEPLAADTETALDRLLDGAIAGTLDRDALDSLAASGDPRLAWIVSDLLRFIQGPDEESDLLAAFNELVGREVGEGPGFEQGAWVGVTDHLIAWDTPAPPGYRDRKAKLFLALEPAWEPFFADADSDIDWRLVSWGGVLIDDRPPGDDDPCPRGCIPALDDPALVPASRGGWYPDARTVFGIEIDGEAVALPKNIMEVHEMVNMTLGGRRLGIPYCTLCGSAQAFFTDVGAGRPLVLRTSGLLSRSNKVMYDLTTRSVFDTFSGEALSGPLHEAGVILEQASVVTSSWGEWKRDHPETRIIAEDGGIGRDYPLDPLHGRDENGPIFPIGDVDPRLPVHAQVAGVKLADGDAIAFPAEAARQALAADQPVTAAGVVLRADGDGFQARLRDGRTLPVHEAFWFAWSQFNPGTRLWSPPV